MPVRSQSSSWNSRQLGVCAPERVRIGVADARDDIPVLSGEARNRQRPSGGDDMQATLRVEHVGQTEQVLLVRAAAMVEDQ